jgi:hypothetical protein
MHFTATKGPDMFYVLTADCSPRGWVDAHDGTLNRRAAIRYAKHLARYGDGMPVAIVPAGQDSAPFFKASIDAAIMAGRI